MSEYLHSSKEAGKLTRGSQRSKGRYQLMDLLLGDEMDIPRSNTLLTEQQKIAKLAAEAPGMCFTSLNHHLSFEWLKEAYKRTRKDGAVGTDKQTASSYEKDLDANLTSLLNRAKSGNYFAPPVRRIYIPKGNKRDDKRPIGIPTFEDKVLQRAVVMLLEPIYEQDFLECSYGFRRGRSAHDAVSAVQKYLIQTKGGWVLDVDLRKFFDTLKHSYLRDLLQIRVRDGVVKRLIGKWLSAGVMEANNNISRQDVGCPQGGVVSPILSNLYLHHVLDVWFHEMVKPRLKGDSFLIRFADDFLIVCKRKDDAKSILNVIPKRFAKYGLAINQEKTKMVDFRLNPSRSDYPKSFDFLGFTFHWDKSRKGRDLVRCKTSKDRLSRSITQTAEWCRRNRHTPISAQRAKLNSMLRGHYNYFGITGNYYSLNKFFRAVCRNWRKFLSSRCQRKTMSWNKFNKLTKVYPLVRPFMAHSVYKA